MDPMGDVSFEDGYISELYKFFCYSSPCWIRMKQLGIQGASVRRSDGRPQRYSERAVGDSSCGFKVSNIFVVFHKKRRDVILPIDELPSFFKMVTTC